MQFVGVDSDKTPLELWKRNVASNPLVAGTNTVSKTVAVDAIDWPDEDGCLPTTR